ncbi:hypothetical protein FHS43_002073 [Streptosporangium becharense]|uniref:VOC domain-containing protein n=1 Tax=Streptosporangium becharense TaxID=1816182 RepID=A0A7W9IBK9_9ACTN|nr:bleomycin resistance protein [Streptosporangium becharense]MBB2910810.1 hypothetical protein [Streptosporangium becharense]MBB5817505.1 hypothetical protein [Streptosporangium becharense]
MELLPAAFSLAPVIPCADLRKSAEVWAALLGAAPTFVDGGRWAQFDLASGRLALSGTDRVSSGPSVMVKVADVAAARAHAAELGLDAGPIETGPHEVRCVVSGPDGWDVVFYAPGNPPAGEAPAS